MSSTSGGDLTITERFARSMSLEDAMNPDNLLCYEMNGVPLPQEHGFPVRLIAPGWYGVANVKWLTRIEVIDQPRSGAASWRATTSRSARSSAAARRCGRSPSVTHDRLKSAPAKVTRRDGQYAVLGAAWGAPIARGGGPDRRRALAARPSSTGSRRGAGASRRVRVDVLDAATGERPPPGEHTIRSRAIDVDGNVQPAPEDPSIADKVTFWESNGQITRTVTIP